MILATADSTSMFSLAPDLNWDVAAWATIASALAAWVALLLSMINMRTARLALHISETQEARRKPSINSYLQDVYIAIEQPNEARVYAVLISLSNRSDNDNGIATATLYLTYAKSGAEFTVKVKPASSTPQIFSDRSAKLLEVPFRIDAHQTISGWTFFSVDSAVLESANITATRIAFVDTYGNETVVEPLNIREYRNAIHPSQTEEDFSGSEKPSDSHIG